MGSLNNLAQLAECPKIAPPYSTCIHLRSLKVLNLKYLLTQFLFWKVALHGEKLLHCPFKNSFPLFSTRCKQRFFTFLQHFSFANRSSFAQFVAKQHFNGNCCFTGWHGNAQCHWSPALVAAMSKDGSPDSNGRHASPPTKMDKLRYAGYSAEFLDRVEPNGNIPDRCGPGIQIIQESITIRSKKAWGKLCWLYNTCVWYST